MTVTLHVSFSPFRFILFWNVDLDLIYVWLRNRGSTSSRSLYFQSWVSAVWFKQIILLIWVNIRCEMSFSQFLFISCRFSCNFKEKWCFQKTLSGRRCGSLTSCSAVLKNRCDPERAPFCQSVRGLALTTKSSFCSCSQGLWRLCFLGLACCCSGIRPDCVHERFSQQVNRTQFVQLRRCQLSAVLLWVSLGS